MEAIWWRWQYYPVRLQIMLSNGHFREFEAHNLAYIDAEEPSQNYHGKTSGEGFIYVLSNKAYPGLVKIGYTRQDPEQRAAQLFSSGVPYPFEIEATFKCKDAQWTELSTHNSLQRFKAGDREFFKLTPIAAIFRIRQIIDF